MKAISASLVYLKGADTLECTLHCWGMVSEAFTYLMGEELDAVVDDPTLKLKCVHDDFTFPTFREDVAPTVTGMLGFLVSHVNMKIIKF